MPPGGPNFFQFHAVFGENLGQSYVGAPWRVGAPPRGKPASATGKNIDWYLAQTLIFLIFWNISQLLKVYVEIASHQTILAPVLLQTKNAMKIL